MPSQEKLLKAYKLACNYSAAELDEQRVEEALRNYLASLRITKKVERLRRGWNVFAIPSLLSYTNRVLEDFSERRPRAATAARDARDARAATAARDARDAMDATDAMAARDAMDATDARVARDATDAMDARVARDATDAMDATDARAARDAMRRFTYWCIQRGNWWWGTEISWQATTYLGALQIKERKVARWAKHIFEAFLAGAWMLHWTEDTLFWVAKPKVHVEIVGGQRRLHNDHYAALESDLEDLYFWHGVFVPAFVVVRPELITAKIVLNEENVEVRRVMIERMGMERFLSEAGAEKIHSHERGELFSIDLPGDPDRVLRAVRVDDPSTGRVYFLRVPPQICRADDAVAWTFGFDVASDYCPVVET